MGKGGGELRQNLSRNIEPHLKIGGPIRLICVIFLYLRGFIYVKLLPVQRFLSQHRRFSWFLLLVELVVSPFLSSTCPLLSAIPAHGVRPPLHHLLINELLLRIRVRITIQKYPGLNGIENLSRIIE